MKRMDWGNDDVIALENKELCYHCGAPSGSNPILLGDKHFCCTGCSTVYQILNQHGLCEYYQQNDKPGITQQAQLNKTQFAFLDEASIAAQLIQFEDGSLTQVCFHLPQMHCSSCLWLLEHLQQLDSGINNSRVDFDKKQLTVLFNREQISLRKLAETLASIGYEPHISLNDIGNKKAGNSFERKRLYRLGVAGFCFGNIMMFSFPEYLGLSGLYSDTMIAGVLRYVVLLLGLPAFFYSGAEFFISGWQGLKHRFLNIDAPIALAVLITFCRSVYEIISGTGSGYLDSMSGIIFFMLVGRVLQDRTRRSLSFDRDYTSYFPVAVSKLEEGVERPMSLPALKAGDTVMIHSNEIIPADGMLVRGNASIDYSFVTGESVPVTKNIGDLCYAGGRQMDGNIELLLVKEVNQSQLTSMWNRESMKSEKTDEDSGIHIISKYFTLLLFSIATVSGLYWAFHDSSKVWLAVTSVLIVACPCTLLLSSSFTNTHIINLFDKAGLYVRNAAVIDRMCRINHIVFDKTGTLTDAKKYTVTQRGNQLNAHQEVMIASLAAQSQHPLSRAVAAWLNKKTVTLESVKEIPGKGTEAWCNDMHIVMGSPAFVWGEDYSADASGAVVAFRIDRQVNGYFLLQHTYRKGLNNLFKKLSPKYVLSVLSGDNDSAKKELQSILKVPVGMCYNQQPDQKLQYIESLANKGFQVMMIGDGLNDAGALKQSLVGIAVADDINNFSPACDAVLSADKLVGIHRYLKLAKASRTIIAASFCISIGYNIIGISFAVQAALSPLIAAILMPLSSISIIFFTWLAVRITGKKLLR